MQKLKTEISVENGMKMSTTYYSEDGLNTTGVVKTLVSDENMPVEASEYQPTQLDRIEAQTAYITMMIGGDI